MSRFFRLSGREIDLLVMVNGPSSSRARQAARTTHLILTAAIVPQRARGERQPCPDPSPLVRLGIGAVIYPDGPAASPSVWRRSCCPATQFMPATSTVCRVFSGSPPRQGLGLEGALLRTNSAESPSSSARRRSALLSFRLARLVQQHHERQVLQVAALQERGVEVEPAILVHGHWRAGANSVGPSVSRSTSSISQSGGSRTNAVLARRLSPASSATMFKSVSCRWAPPASRYPAPRRGIEPRLADS